MTTTRHSRVVHGGIDLTEISELGLKPEDVIDFSSSLNPLGPPDQLLECLSVSSIGNYPEPHAASATRTLARHLNLPVQRVTLGNGSTQLIHLIAQARSSSTDLALILGPTFGEYRAACDIAGIASIEHRSSRADGFTWNTDEIGDLIAQKRPGIVFLCNPNNPTGSTMPIAQIRSLIERMDESGIFVIDDSYASLSDNSVDSLELLESPNVLILRSLTKSLAIPGLRVGCGIGSPDLIEEISAITPSWSVNGPAQVAVELLPELESHIEEGQRIVREQRTRLTEWLNDRDVAYVPSSANFLLIKVTDAEAVRGRLLRSGYCVRDCTSFGLPGYIRVGIRQQNEMDLLMKGLEQAL